MNFKACPFTRRRACKARASKPRRRPSRPSYISRSRLPVRRRLIDRPRADRLLLTGCSKGKVRPATTCLAARSPGLELEESVSGGVLRLPCLRRFGGQRRPAGRGADRVRCVRLRHLPTTSLLVDARQSRTVPCAFVTLHVLVMRAREIDAPGVPRLIWWVSHVTLEIRSSVDSRGSRVVAPVSFAGHSPRSLREQSTRRRARRSVQRCVTRWPS